KVTVAAWLDIAAREAASMVRLKAPSFDLHSGIVGWAVFFMFFILFSGSVVVLTGAAIGRDILWGLGGNTINP
ncbi:MAG TPA: hypothetical protein VFF11_15455, partial [Candidatus Binatia bacterium]|nr:hypothetical protein [Candidatus Binatia bacterium]